MHMKKTHKKPTALPFNLNNQRALDVFFVFLNVYHKSIMGNVCNVQYGICIYIKYCGISIVRE